MQICALSILYQPDFDQFFLQQTALLDSVHWRVWVDNAAHNPELAKLAQQLGASYLPLGENLGIATAQNKGIAWARQQGASHVLLLDQDSILGPLLINELARLLAQLQQIHLHSVIAPRYQLQNGQMMRGFIGERDLSSAFSSFQNSLVQCDCMIAAGMLIPLSVFDLAGPMRDELFIDLVDAEWCYRAQAKGAYLFGLASYAPALLMQHSLGENSLKIWCLRWRNLLVYSPARNYYQIRNAVVLLRCPYVPLSHRIFQLFSASKLVFFNLLWAGQVAKRIRLVFKGIADGFRGRLGALNNVAKPKKTVKL